MGVIQSRLAASAIALALVIGLAWVDYRWGAPGIAMSPLALAAALLGGAELVRLFEHSGKRDPTTGRALDAPSRYVVATGAALMVVASYVPTFFPSAFGAGGPSPLQRAGVVAVALLLALGALAVVEITRFRGAGSATNRLARGYFAVAYTGGLPACLVLLRTLSGPPWDTEGRWGMVALLSMLACAKAGDTGAYLVGRMMGRRRMAPLLSPGKTWEGAAGGLIAAILAALLTLGPLTHGLGLTSARQAVLWFLGAVAYGAVVNGVGVLGDLTASMLKRDAALKNSSTWMPGFGGVLDTLDSVLLAAPIAYLLWILRVVGP